MTPGTAEGKNLPLTSGLTITETIHMGRIRLSLVEEITNKVKAGNDKSLREESETSTRDDPCLVCSTLWNQTLHQQAADKRSCP